MSALATQLQRFIKEKSSVSTTQDTSEVKTSTVVPQDISTTESSSSSVSNYTNPILYVRSRNVAFDSKALKPLTRFYPFFAGIDVSRYVTPKLLEIEMVSGAFQSGETVESDATFTTNYIKFRLCKPNHKTGPYDGTQTDTSSVYDLNPYTQQTIPETYSNTSTFLNVDTLSLQLASETSFYGSVAVGMRLIGRTSGAIAVVNNLRLVSDRSGRLIGSYYIPDSSKIGNPKFITGVNPFTLVDVESVFLNPSSFAEEIYTATGYTNVTETNIITTRTVTITPPYTLNTTTVTNTTTNTTTKVKISASQRTQLQSELSRLQQRLTTLTPDRPQYKSTQEEITIITNILSQTQQ
jgi:hypothetical protein